MSKKNFLIDQLNELKWRARNIKDENEEKFLSAIRTGDLETIKSMRATHQAPGVLLTPLDQLKSYIELAANYGANEDMFKELFEIYPNTLNERLLLENSYYVGLNENGRRIYGQKDCVGMGCIRYENDYSKQEGSKDYNNTPSDCRPPEYRYIESTRESHKSCFAIALEISHDCARALIDTLKGISNFRYTDMLTKKEELLDQASKNVPNMR